MLTDRDGTAMVPVRLNRRTREELAALEMLSAKVGCWKSSGMRVIPPGKSYRRNGWLLKNLWYEGNTTCLTLTALQPKCAEYAVLHGLADELAF
jgi:hypothetical protein